MVFIPEHIKNLEPYKSARDLYSGDYLFLDANENCFGELINIESILGKFRLSDYGDTDSTELRKVLANFYNIDIDEIAIFNGSDAAIPDILTAFSEKNDNIAGLDVGFGMFRSFCEIHKRNYISLKTDKDFNLIMGANLEKELKNTKITFIDSPNNPSGRAQTHESLMNLVNLVKLTNNLLVIDEAYYEFMKKKESRTFIKVAPQLNNVLIMRSFSKAWSLASGRLGFVVGNKDLISTLIKVRIPYHVSATSQSLGIEAIKQHKEMERRIKLIKEYRNELTKGLRDLGLHVYLSETNFLFVKFPDNSREIFEKLISDYKIVLRYFGGGDTLAGKNNKLANCIRITVGLPAQNKKLLLALSEILNLN